MLITVVTLRYQCQSFLDTAEPFYFTVSVNQLHINAKVSWQLIWKQMFQRNRDNSRNSSLKFLDFFFSPENPEFQSSNFVFTLQPECHWSINSRVNNNRQSENLTSCLHFLYVETKFLMEKVTILEKCEKTNQENCFVLWKKQQQQNPKHFRILFSVKN